MMEEKRSAIDRRGEHLAAEAATIATATAVIAKDESKRLEDKRRGAKSLEQQLREGKGCLHATRREGTPSRESHARGHNSGNAIFTIEEERRNEPLISFVETELPPQPPRRAEEWDWFEWFVAGEEWNGGGEDHEPDVSVLGESSPFGPCVFEPPRIPESDRSKFVSVPSSPIAPGSVASMSAVKSSNGPDGNVTGEESPSRMHMPREEATVGERARAGPGSSFGQTFAVEGSRFNEDGSDVAPGSVVLARPPTEARLDGGDSLLAAAQGTRSGGDEAPGLANVPTRRSAALRGGKRGPGPIRALSEGPSTSCDGRSEDNFIDRDKFWGREREGTATVVEGAGSVEIEADVAAEDGGSSDPDSDQPFHFLSDVNDTAAEEEQTESPPMCTDCDGDWYLKIYDIDCGKDEVIHRHPRKLETVKESSSEEDEGEEEGCSPDKKEEEEFISENCMEDEKAKKEEAGIYKALHSVEKSGESESNELHELYSLVNSLSKEEESRELEEASYDVEGQSLKKAKGSQSEESHQNFPNIGGYLAASKHKNTTTPGDSHRKVNSSKKRYIHTKKRAIAKAKSKKTEYHIAAFLGNRPHSKTLFDESMDGPNHTSSALDVSFDGIMTRARDTLADQKNNVTLDAEYEKHVRLKKTIPVLLAEGEHKVSFKIEGEESVSSKDTCSPENDDSHFFFSGNSSIDSFASIFTEEESEEDNVEKDSGPGQSEQLSSPGPELRTGMSLTLSKLYDENLELAEALVTTQSELEKVSRKLESVRMERNEIIATARFEM